MSARIISTLGRAIGVILAGRVESHLRFAAGVCVLAAGLLMGSAGGAVAVADPDSSGSAAPGDGGTNASGQGSTTASSPVGNVTRRKTTQGVTSTLGSGRQRGQQPSTGAKSPKKAPRGTDTEDEKKDSRLAAAVPNVVAPVPNVVAPVPNVVAPVSDVIAPVPNVVAPVPNVVALVPNVVAPVPNLVAPVSDVIAPVTNVVAPVSDLIAPVTNVVAPVSDVIAPVTNVVAPVSDLIAPVTNVVAPVSDVIAPVTNVVAPVSDVIAPVQDMLTSVAGAVVPPTQLQSDLSSFSLGIAGVEPVGNGLGGIDGAGLSATAGASIFGAMSEAGRASSLPGMAPPAPNGAIPMGVRSFPRHALHDLPVAVSLAELAAVALPTVGGLVILTLAVVGVGYRQEKADFALRTAGLARFARRGAGQGAASRLRSNP